MLKTFYRLKDLDFQMLMAVYEEGNLENALEFYPDDSPDVQLQKVKQSFEDYLREDFFRVKGVRYAVWEEAGEYISALRLEPYEDGFLLEALETMPARRRMGYSMKLISAVLEELPKGTTVYSHVGKRNAASLGAHLRCGFEKHLDYAKYIDGTVTLYCLTLKKIV